MRSYRLRGSRITAPQQSALDKYWGKYGIDYSVTPIDPAGLFPASEQIILEIEAAADATARELEYVAAARQNQAAVDSNPAELIDEDGDAAAERIAEDSIERRGLARPRPADEGEGLPRTDAEGDVRDGGRRAVLGVLAL